MTIQLVLADDNPTIQQVVRLCFQKEPVEVHCFSDGREALRHIESRPSHVILADVSLPGLDGYEMCRQIKLNSRTAHVPVVLLVGAFESLDLQKAEQVGYHCALVKPLGTMQLVDLVRQLAKEPVKERFHPKPSVDQEPLDLRIPLPIERDDREALFRLAPDQCDCRVPGYGWTVLPGDRSAVPPEAEAEGRRERIDERFLTQLTGRLQVELPRLISEIAESLNPDCS